MNNDENSILEIVDKVTKETQERATKEDKGFMKILEEELIKESLERIALVEYDHFGKMKYNPDLHFNQGKAWKCEDVDYLIKWFAKTGLEEMSLALGRTEGSIARKIHELRKQGKMSFESGYNIRLLKDRNKYQERKSPNPNGRPPKLKVDIETLIKLKETKTFKEIAAMYKVSASIVEKRIMKYRKATKDPDQSIQSSITKNSIPLYHESRGVQVV